MMNWQKMLVAVNDSDDAMFAVHYVGKAAQKAGDLSITLLFVYPDPPPDYYHKGGTLGAYKEIMNDQGRKVMKQATDILGRYDIPQDNIKTDIRLAKGKTISQAILETRKEQDFSTLVVGKRGISKNEEFLFGSISNTLARESREFTTWVVG